MRRDLEKTIAKGRAIIEKNERRDLSFSEVIRLKEMSTDDTTNYADAIFNAISNAFLAGVAVGSKVR